MTAKETFESLFKSRFGRLPTQEELSAMIDQSVTSYNQTGGITARNVNIGPQPRRLNDDTKQRILSGLPNKPIEVIAAAGDAEIMNFAREILNFLREHNIPLAHSIVVQGHLPMIPEGLLIQENGFLIVGSNT